MKTPRHALRGFTLVELLVVITIIALLLSLLTPALEKAIYQAELAVCGGTLRTLGSRVLEYAGDHKRRYPYRPSVDGVTGRRPSILKIFSPTTPDNHNDDHRVTIKDYIPVNKMYQCPLVKAIDLEKTDDDSGVYASYSGWYGWRYGASKAAAQKGMNKLGDRFHWKDPTISNSPDHSFRVLAADVAASFPGSYHQNSHPDSRGEFYNLVLQDKASGENAVFELFSPPTLKLAISIWTITPVREASGTLDRNYVLDDMSVQRYDREVIDDPRLIAVPERALTSNYTASDERTWLPEN